MAAMSASASGGNRALLRNRQTPDIREDVPKQENRMPGLRKEVRHFQRIGPKIAIGFQTERYKNSIINIIFAHPEGHTPLYRRIYPMT